MKKWTLFIFLLLLVSCQGEKSNTKNFETLKEGIKQVKNESQEQDCADEGEVEKKVFAKENQASSSESSSSLSLDGGGETGCTLDESL